MQLRTVEEHLVLCLEHAPADPNAAGLEGLKALMAATHAQDGYYLLAMRLKGRPRLNAADRLFGFRVMHHQRVLPHTAEALRLVSTMVASSEYVIEPSAAVVARQSHKRSAWLVREKAGGAQYLQAPLAKEMKVRDELRATYPLGADGYVLFSVVRHRRRFVRSDCARVRTLLPLLSSALLRLGEHHGIFDGKWVLGPREVEVYRLLQTDKTEKEIAHALALSAHTVHELVGTVFKKVGVKGRLGLWSRTLTRLPRRSPLGEDNQLS